MSLCAICQASCPPRRATCGKACHARLVSLQRTGKARATGPRSKACPECQPPFSSPYPSALKRVTHCSRRCLAKWQMRRMAQQRLGNWQKKYGELSAREIALMAYAYQLGYARRANRERVRRATQAA